MKRKYIGVKMIEAEPMTRYGKMELAGLRPDLAKDAPVDEPGYQVTYPDGYTSWSPADTFEAAYFPLTFGDKLSDVDVEAFVRNDDGEILVSRIGDKTAVAHVKCVSGFELTETSACSKKEDYDQEIGVGVSLMRIKDALQEHLEFVLQWAINGINMNHHTGEDNDG